ncbi:PREDICTED: uncharacterized protein LOC104587289 [Nelumbo nucifera]|uniref:Uncharacterized protein LOC104587289 n=1 Tax=Nelumbo nucifera TaxID=4432 RepID=A0A1U7YV42_NELNU|nr:PREDICTED: uncharacterized protein LOC104587289 [Nelumbo nucifera]
MASSRSPASGGIIMKQTWYLFDGVQFDPIVVICKAHTEIDRCLSLLGPMPSATLTLLAPGLVEVWSKPVVNFLKVNSNVSFKHGVGSVGLVIRDHIGTFLLAEALPIKCESSIMAEALALYHGLLLVQELRLSYVIIEGDAYSIFKLMLVDDFHPPWQLIHIITACKSLLPNLHSCSVNCV